MRWGRRTIRLTRLGKLTLTGAALALGCTLAAPHLMRATQGCCTRTSPTHPARVRALEVAVPGAGLLRFEGRTLRDLSAVDAGGGEVTLRWRNGYRLELLGGGSCGTVYANLTQPGEVPEPVELAGGRIYQLGRGIESWRPNASSLNQVDGADRSASGPRR